MLAVDLQRVLDFLIAELSLLEVLLENAVVPLCDRLDHGHAGLLDCLTQLRGHIGRVGLSRAVSLEAVGAALQ